MPEPVGFIGLGIMGEGMVRNIAKMDGQEVVVWNRSSAKSDALKTEFKEKVVVAETAGAVVERCGLTFSMMSDLEASAAVFPDVLSKVAPGKSIVDCATLTPEAMREMAEKVKAKGGAFLEAPVSGTKKPAAEGQLIFLTAGSKEVLEMARPYLEAMGKSTRWYGDEVGQGTKMKLVVNMTMGSMMAAISEGMALAEASNLDADAFMAVINEGAMACPMYKVKNANFSSRTHPPAFPLKHAHKDMKFALGLGAATETPLPMCTAAESVFSAAPDALREQDFSALSEVARKPSAAK